MHARMRDKRGPLVRLVGAAMSHRAIKNRFNRLLGKGRTVDRFGSHSAESTSTHSLFFKTLDVAIAEPARQADHAVRFATVNRHVSALDRRRHRGSNRFHQKLPRVLDLTRFGFLGERVVRGADARGEFPLIDLLR
jgi:hypothetical protein